MIERTDPANWSTIKHLLVSPRHYRHALANPRGDTDALKLGRVLHALVYEPHTVGSLYAVMPRFHAGQNDDTAIKNGYDGGKQARVAWEAEHSGREVVASDLWVRAVAMRESIMADPCARAMVEGGLAEQPIEWTDVLTGIACRGRVDHINGRLSDLKSTSNLPGFAREVAKYRYHGQLAYYSDGLEANGFEFLYPPVLIAVESSPPFDVAVFSVGPDTLAAGRALYRKALDTLAECRALDRWPGIGGGEIREVLLPAWAMAEPDEEPITVGGERIS